MTKRVNKFNKLNNIESFIQVNLFKGFKYIDKAGELVNNFYKGNNSPQFTMNLEGLVIFKPDDITEEIKITPLGFWAHYLKPASLDQISNSYIKSFDDVVKVLEVNKITRVGWRNYLVYEYSSVEDRENALKKFNLNTNIKIESLVYQFELDSINSVINIRKASKNDDKKTPALLLDIDSFVNFDNTTTLEKVSNELINIRKMLHSDNFLEEINTILK